MMKDAEYGGMVARPHFVGLFVHAIAPTSSSVLSRAFFATCSRITS